ncbi:hypothetical protein B0H10DRAFT_2054942 [Mycena sp. CBHHK59/15]|nr:hypothetical protein B0H10DRAFT_2054942 [Mycena sp. CBHHK59/15]
MMGWTEGTGLGTTGDGRVDPMFVPSHLYSDFGFIDCTLSSTAVYAQGVGLGASKGKDIAKYTEGASSYIHLAQDAVRKFHDRFSPGI